MKEEEPEAKSASAPARAAEVAPVAKPAAAKGKGSAIASMWSKAPAKKAKKGAPQKAAAQPSLKEKAAAVDAEAFMRLNQQVHSVFALPSQQNQAGSQQAVRGAPEPLTCMLLTYRTDQGHPREL